MGEINAAWCAGRKIPINHQRLGRKAIAVWKQTHIPILRASIVYESMKDLLRRAHTAIDRFGSFGILAQEWDGGGGRGDQKRATGIERKCTGSTCSFWCGVVCVWLSRCLRSILGDSEALSRLGDRICGAAHKFTEIPPTLENRKKGKVMTVWCQCPEIRTCRTRDGAVCVCVVVCRED